MSVSEDRTVQPSPTTAGPATGIADPAPLGLAAVATNAVVMAHPEDWSRHRLLRAIHLNTTISE